MLCEKSQLREFRNVIAQSHGEGLYEGSAARGAGLVEHDAVDAAVFDLEALDVLTADVDDEVNVGAEVSCGLEMGHCLNDTVVDGEAGLDQVLAVAGNCRAPDVHLGAKLCVDPLQLSCDLVQRLSLI